MAIHQATPNDCVVYTRQGQVVVLSTCQSTAKRGLSLPGSITHRIAVPLRHGTAGEEHVESVAVKRVRFLYEVDVRIPVVDTSAFTDTPDAQNNCQFEVCFRRRTHPFKQTRATTGPFTKHSLLSRTNQHALGRALAETYASAARASVDKPLGAYKYCCELT